MHRPGNTAWVEEDPEQNEIQEETRENRRNSMRTVVDIFDQRGWERGPDKTGTIEDWSTEDQEKEAEVFVVRVDLGAGRWTTGIRDLRCNQERREPAKTFC